MSDTLIRDPLTGAYTRGMLGEQLRIEVERVRRYGEPCSILVFDIDHFKSVNDAFGHTRGDEVLSEVVRRVRQCIRASDQLFRYGGDEFVVLLPSSSKAAAELLAGRLLEAIRCHPFDGPVPLDLSLSIGVATCPADTADEQALFQIADTRSYKAKRGGRGRVVSEDDRVEAAPAFAEVSRLVERDEALDAAQQFFSDLSAHGRGVLRLVGPDGSGRTRLLAEVEKRAKMQGFAMVPVRGDPALKPTPHGALALALPELTLAANPCFTLDAIAIALARRAAASSSGRLLLSVDNLTQLDWGTQDLLRQLLAAPGANTMGMVYTGGSAGPGPPALVAPLLAEIQLRPLSKSGLRIWLRAAIQWEAPAEFLTWLEEQTGGLPAQVERLILQLIEEGLLRHQEQEWRLLPGYGAPSRTTRPPARRAPEHNLPAVLTSFVGRARELAEVRRLLGSTRLLTLTGPGGMGKTRLSLQIGGELMHSFRDGVWLVELAPLTDPALLLPTVAALFGVRQETGRPLQATLCSWLSSRQLLCILDNCEHLIDACAQFADAALRSAPELRILASSREPLDIAGEQVYRVPPLQSPLAADSIPPEELATYEAVRLFTERASFAEPSFRLTAQVAPVVARICSRLDGIPLAIELAAARLRALELDEIAARLDDRFALLASGNRAALPRHQTLRALIDWSYDLLAKSERALLRRLAVFAGSWSSEAAVAICSEQQASGLRSEREQTAILPPAEVGDLLGQLVDKSLVVLDGHGVEPRYQMLETIRQYAWEKLAEAGETALFESRHLRWHADLAERIEPHLQGPQRAEWLRRLELDRDNLRAALEWACEHDVEMGRRLAGALFWFWQYTDDLNRARAWYARLLALGDGETATWGQAQILFGAGATATTLLHFDEAEALLERSVALWRQFADPERLAWAYTWLAYLHVFRGRCASAAVIYEENETALRGLGDRVVVGLALIYWGRALMQVNRADPRAQTRLAEGLAMGLRLQDPYVLTSAYLNLGHWALEQRDYAAARDSYMQGLHWSRELGTRWIIADFLRTLGTICYLDGAYEQAEPLYAESLALKRADGDQVGAANGAQALAFALLHLGKKQRARELLDEALATCRRWGSALGVGRCLRAYGELWLANDDAVRAAQLLGFIEAWLEAHGLTLGPLDAAVYERGVREVGSRLDAAVLVASWAEGRALTLDEASARAEARERQ